ncbi:MAG: DUF4340 domain-containing protein [Planctomycetota bacterium]|jgi:hypothetical protein
MSEPTPTPTPTPNNEWTATLGLLAAAILLTLITVFTAPTAPRPEEFNDEGGTLVANFTDPVLAASIEIIDVDPNLQSLRRFKVERQGGHWVIPSHENYPAEAEERVVKVSAGVIGLVKGALQSSNPEDYEKLGVGDPEKGPTAGRRCVLRDQSGNPLADFIVGNPVPNRQGFRFVRNTADTSTYAVDVQQLDLSTDFFDWIEKDLLKVDAFSVRRIELDHYSVDERRGMIVPGERITLTRDKGGDPWTIDDLKTGERLDTEKVTGILNALADLELANVRRKPAGLTADLRRGEGIALPQAVLLSLQSAGYYIDGRNNALVSNEGELRFWTENGVWYILRFGELAATGDADSERRYLFVSADYDEGFLPEPTEPPKPTEPKEGDPPLPEGQVDLVKKAYEEWQEAHAEWKQKSDAGKKKAKELNDRFAEWYYVIPGKVYHDVKLKRADLILKSDGGDEDEDEDDGKKERRSSCYAAGRGAAHRPV